MKKISYTYTVLSSIDVVKLHDFYDYRIFPKRISIKFSVDKISEIIKQMGFYSLILYDPSNIRLKANNFKLVHIHNNTVFLIHEDDVRIAFNRYVKSLPPLCIRGTNDATGEYSDFEISSDLLLDEFINKFEKVLYTRVFFRSLHPDRTVSDTILYFLFKELEEKEREIKRKNIDILDLRDICRHCNNGDKKNELQTIELSKAPKERL